MKNPERLIVGLALAFLLFATPVNAQGPIEGDASMQVGNATVTVGGGTAILTLPDVPSMMLRGVNGVGFALLQTYRLSDDFGDEFGWNVNGSIVVPMGATKTVSLNGFWAKIDDDNSATCTPGGGERCLLAPLVDDPTIAEHAGTLGQMNSRGKREVDHWGVSLESKWTQGQGIMGVTRAPTQSYFAIAIDVRGIDQEISEDITYAGAPTATYREDLDTRYYGAYAAWGRDYTLPFLSGLTGGLGLQSSFLLRGGIYYADTDYEGRLTSTFVGPNPTSTLSLSSDDVAFIGGLVLETRKRIGQRAMLSLKSEYEYYSWVPEMTYNQRDQNGGTVISPNGQNGTRIGDDDAFSARTSLRLTIGLGPSDLYQ